MSVMEKPESYPRPMVTVDVVMFTIRENRLDVLLIKRNLPPFVGKWALPGGFVHIDESIEDGAKRELREETGLHAVYLEQLYTFGTVKRDPRGRVITVAYYALIPPSAGLDIRADTDASETRWFDLRHVPPLAFDHSSILEYALKRMRWKFEYTTAGFSMLSKNFTLNEIQQLYETVFGREFDKANFRKKIIQLNILSEVGVKTDVAHRPPKLYQLKADAGPFVKMV